MSALYIRVRDFLFSEAHLLDERKFEEWLELFTPDSYYWMPCRMDAVSRGADSAIISDTRADLEMRIRRLRHPAAHTESPPSNSMRLVSNVTILSEAPLQVRSKLIVHEFQRRAYARDDHRVFCATVHYELTQDNDSFKISWKRVNLVDGEGARTMMPTPL